MLTALLLYVSLMQPLQVHERPAIEHGTVPRALVVDSIFTPSLGVWKRVIVYLPAAYEAEPSRRYPVAYYLHGYSGSESDWPQRVRLDSVAAALEKAGGPPVILVMPDADDSWYLNWKNGESYEACAARRRTGAGTYCVHRSDYEDYIVKDLVPFIDGRYRTRADRAHRGVAGLSAGGYGALKFALKYPDMFGAALSQAGVVSPLMRGMDADGKPVYTTAIDSGFMMNGGYRPHFRRALGDDVAEWRANDPAALVRGLLREKRPLPAL